MPSFFVRETIKHFMHAKNLTYREGDAENGRGIFADIDQIVGHNLDEADDRNNKRLLSDWYAAHEHLHSPDDHREPIDLDLERQVLGKGNLTARVKLLNRYGAVMYAERLAAWGCDPKTNTPGVEPGTVTEEVIKEAKKVVEKESANSPFNPARTFKNDKERFTAIDSYIKFFGCTAASKAAAKFNVDIAGRPLRARA